MLGHRIFNEIVSDEREMAEEKGKNCKIDRARGKGTGEREKRKHGQRGFNKKKERDDGKRGNRRTGL